MVFIFSMVINIVQFNFFLIWKIVILDSFVGMFIIIVSKVVYLQAN